MIIKEIRNQLERIINDIDSGNSNMSDDESKELLDYLIRIGEPKLSKYQARKYINCGSIDTFNKMVAKGILPKGQHQIGFKELFWKKSDLDKYIEAQQEKLKNK